MATVKEFLTRINRIEGVNGCLLVKKDDGALLGQIIDNHEKLSSLLYLGGKCSRDIMDSAGFTHCSLLSFRRENGKNFHMFGVDKYYLGVMQDPEYPLDPMIQKVNHLLSFVNTGKAKKTKGTQAGGAPAGSL